MNFIKRLGSLFGQQDDISYQLYGALVAQARSKSFFANGGVPDTMDGRFDLMVLHAFLLIRRLNKAGNAGEELAQQVFDGMFLDLDNSLREIGVGDLSVPKKIKVMAKAFYGRCEAYEEAMDNGDKTNLEQVIGRNIFADFEPPKGALSAIATYMIDSEAELTRQKDEKILYGEATFPVFKMRQDTSS